MNRQFESVKNKARHVLYAEQVMRRIVHSALAGSGDFSPIQLFAANPMT